MNKGTRYIGDWCVEHRNSVTLSAKFGKFKQIPDGLQYLNKAIGFAQILVKLSKFRPLDLISCPFCLLAVLCVSPRVLTHYVTDKRVDKQCGRPRPRSSASEYITMSAGLRAREGDVIYFGLFKELVSMVIG